MKSDMPYISRTVTTGSGSRVSSPSEFNTTKRGSSGRSHRRTMTIRKTTSILIQQMPTSALAVEGRLISLNAICLRLLDGIQVAVEDLVDWQQAVQGHIGQPDRRERNNSVAGAATEGAVGLGTLLGRLNRFDVKPKIEHGMSR